MHPPNPPEFAWVGKPDDFERIIAALLSNGSEYINAQSIEVSGGYII